MDGNNWDLFAVVRGCLPAVTMNDLPCFMSSSAVKDEAVDDEVLNFGEGVPMSEYIYEFEDICKGFHVESEEQELQAQHHSEQLMKTNIGASMFPAIAATPQQFEQELKQLQKPPSQTPRTKRRKSQQKKIVCQVPADAVSNDMWAWRKYGQKPIKGSPYPRGYYRCSSSKGCQARKQVERSRANPSMLIITYTAEHNHQVPTHRNSLAGSTRQKYSPPSSSPQPPTTPPSNGASNKDNMVPPGNTSTSSLSSPRIPFEESIDDKLLIGEEDELLSVGDVELMDENDFMFLGMEVLGVPAKSPATSSGYVEDEQGSFEDHFLRPAWFSANNNAAAAAGGS